MAGTWTVLAAEGLALLLVLPGALFLPQDWPFPCWVSVRVDGAEALLPGSCGWRAGDAAPRG